ncbi:MAG: CehA/McbA family metallohydrolase [Anaerolineales bacterium]|nr:CehA/McbA family metallohydrolase [Anaerolineales bacterium]
MPHYNFSKIFNPNPGWYSGDFHVHTTASDGDYPPFLVAEIAKAEGLDFIAISDHNTIAGFSELKEDLDFLVIPGIEITLDKGHFNVFGMDGWHEWMDGVSMSQRGFSLSAKYRTMSELMRQTSAEGLLNSINHPHLYPWEWLYNDTDLHYVHCLEIWNDLYFLPDNAQANPRAVALWTNWLNAGHRITAIGGSDYHFPPRPEEGKPGERLGYPATYVYAETLSVEGILDGLQKHRAYVSRGPQVDFEAEINGQIYGIGADIGETQGEIEFTATISSSLTATQAQLVRNGEFIATQPSNREKIQVRFTDQADPTHSAWYRLEVSNLEGQTLAITNPIFVGPLRQSELHKFGDFVKN